MWGVEIGEEKVGGRRGGGVGIKWKFGGRGEKGCLGVSVLRVFVCFDPNKYEWAFFFFF